MWNLKNKTGKQTQQNRNRVIDTEYKQVVGEGGQGMNEVRMTKTHKLPVSK